MSSFSNPPPDHTDGSDASHVGSASSSPPPSGAAGSSERRQNYARSACAACKYRRARCTPECPLARYFPAEQNHLFVSVHRLFGVDKILRTLREVPPEDAREAMRTMIFEAEARASDPVSGCVGIIRQYQHEVSVANDELMALRHKIATCRSRADGGLPLADPAIPAVPEQDNVRTRDALDGGGAAQEPAHSRQPAAGGLPLAYPATRTAPEQNNVRTTDALDSGGAAQEPVHGRQPAAGGLPLADPAIPAAPEQDNAMTTDALDGGGAAQAQAQEPVHQAGAGVAVVDDQQQHHNAHKAPDLEVTTAEHQYTTPVMAASSSRKRRKVAAPVVKHDADP